MPVRYPKPPPCRQQRGNTLIIALLLVLLLSVFGMQGYQTMVLEEHMAGNVIDQQRAFQLERSRDAAEQYSRKALCVLGGL